MCVSISPIGCRWSCFARCRVSELCRETMPTGGSLAEGGLELSVLLGAVAASTTSESVAMGMAWS